MIEAVCSPGRVTLRGHAGYAPRGQDIVCAAASALIYALIAVLEERGQLCELVIRPGFVTAAAHEEDSAFEMVRCGLVQLAERYPAWVSVRQEERSEEDEPGN